LFMVRKSKAKYIVKIDASLCKGCRRCVKACPKSLIKMNDAINAMGFPTASCQGEGCIGCGACFYGCPEAAAISIYEDIEDGEE